MRNLFGQQLAQLNHDMTRMGALCEEAIAVATKFLLDGDMERKERVTALEAEIDKMERDIEHLCMRLLLKQQPVARDLRQISAALKMITDMERIGDQALDIVDIVPYLGGKTVDECEDIRKMAEATIKMVVESVDAYVKGDLNLARSVIQCDQIVDEYFASVKKSLIAMIADQRVDGEYALDLLMIAKYFERIGDHATNIAEWVEFSVTGVHEESEDQ